MVNLLEAAMVIAFGLSWPLSILKSYRAGTARGKSVLFLILIEIGYYCGIISKLIAHFDGSKPLNYVFVFYVINAILVFCDILLYIRNKRLDKQKNNMI